MVASEPNYRRMAHRSIDPAKGEAAIRGALPSAVDLVPTAGKVLLSLEGGRHQSFEAAEAYLSTQNLPWQIVHSDEVTTYHRALLRGLEHCKSPLVAIIPPWIEIKDKLWVQRMVWTLSSDPRSLLCTTGTEQGPAKDLAPFICLPRKWPGGEIIFGRRDPLTGILRMVKRDNFYDNLARAVDAAGWRLWSHPGIRFERLEHEDHDEARQETRTKGRQTQGRFGRGSKAPLQ